MRGDMSVGTVWAYRERPRMPGTPAFEVEIVRHGPADAKQVRIRFCGGEFEGLEQWVPANRLVVPWHEFHARERDDVALRALKGGRGSMFRSVIEDAAGLVNGVLPGPLQNWDFSHGLVYSRSYPEIEDALDVPRGRLLEFPGAFVDRRGCFFGPPECKEFVIRRICELHPGEILARLSKEIRTLDENAVRGGYLREDSDVFFEPEWWAEQRLQLMPGIDLVRQWCGVEAAERSDELLALRLEVQRLQPVIVRLAEEARKNGHHHEFRRLLEEAGFKVPPGRLKRGWIPDGAEPPSRD